MSDKKTNKKKNDVVILKRVVVDSKTPSVADDAQQKNQKKTQKVSNVASSGLRSGYEVRKTDDVAYQPSVNDQTAGDSREAATPAGTSATSAPTVRRVKRIVKDAPSSTVPPVVPEKVPTVAPITSVEPMATKKHTSDVKTDDVNTDAAAITAKKVINVSQENTVKQTEKKEILTETRAQAKEEKDLDYSQLIYREEIEVTLKPVPVAATETKANAVVPQKGTSQTFVQNQRRPQAPLNQNTQRDGQGRENRFSQNISQKSKFGNIDAPVVASNEPKRDYSNKIYEKTAKMDKIAKKENREKPVSSSTVKDKYRSARQLVGEQKSLSDIYSDDHHTSYDDNMDSGYGRRGGSKGRKESKKDKYASIRDLMPAQTAVLTNVKIPDTITVKDFAETIKKSAVDVIKKLMLMGVMATQNQVIDFDTATLIAAEYGITAEKQVIVTDEDILFEDPDDLDVDDSYVERPPVVVVMGHVDHGKTSLLDAIRSTSVTSGEAGGITQHIGAYMVRINDRKITFLDTPGHEAFTSMRARGAQVTDVAILVVAADDGVKPQTIEAINHAKAAKVSIVVAVNKIDKPSANIDKVMTEMAEHEIVPEEWGGDVPFVPVSAKTGENIELLLETVLLCADVLELKASPVKQAKGTVIEAKLDKNIGPVATLLVQRGTLKAGDAIISGMSFGHIRTMVDDKGNNIKKATPSTPVEITGLQEVPVAGETFYAIKDERVAKHLADQRKSQMRESTIHAQTKISLDDLFSQIQAGDVKELNIIVKADVVGSVEAVKQSLQKLTTDEVKVNIIHGAVGSVTESDIQLASVSNAIIIGFNVRPAANITESAKDAGVDIRLYSVIYDAIEDVKAAMIGMLDPEYKENVTGHIEVRQTFKVSGVGTIAGGYVLDGKVLRHSDVRIVRDGIVVFQGKLASLKRFKDDVKEVAQGFECGLSFENYNDIKEGDIVEAYVMEEVKRHG